MGPDGPRDRRRRPPTVRQASAFPLVALAGNPNTGKSTLFNALTGLNQHTGNWPGKTVLMAHGVTRHRDRSYTIVDLPGTYSLLASSAEERVASDFLCLKPPDVTVVVADAGCLERNLNLALQVMEVTDRAVLCVNLVDEARRRGLELDLRVLAEGLGIPVVATVARKGRGLLELMDAVAGICDGIIVTAPKRVAYEPDIEEALARLERQFERGLPPGAAARWHAIRALCGDPAPAGTAAAPRALTPSVRPASAAPGFGKGLTP